MITADQLTIDDVYKLAPDAETAQAALKLVRQGRFRSLAVASDRLSLRGRCQGSEPRPYNVRAELLADALGLGTRGITLVSGCNCLSYRNPCKHAVGLLLAYVQAPQKFRVEAAPKRDPVPAADAPPVRKKKEKEAVLPSREEMEAAFLRAVLEAPDDDTPRLIYADWLQENGDPERGEFIQVQCQLARPDLEEPRRLLLGERAGELLAKNRQAWLAALPGFLGRMQPEFRRGFVESVTTTVKPFVRHAEKLFAAAPVRAAHFLPARPGRREHAGLFSQVTSLAGCDSLVRLACLELPDYGLDAELLGHLVSTPYPRNVRVLNLHGNNLGYQGMRRLADATFLTSLTELDLSETGLGPAAVRILAETPWLVQLTVLDLSYNRFDTAAAQALASSPHLAGLRRLDVPGCDIGPAGRKALQGRFGPRLVQDAT
jgi:uncharacterized protein (TIGR02996 family)